MQAEDKTKKFYNNYWPENIPDYKKTEEHIFSLLPQREFSLTLDAGCGAGVCSLALSKKSSQVISCDLSLESLKTAAFLKKKFNIININFLNANLLNLPFQNNTFDLVLSWGVIHHTQDPNKAFLELTRVIKKGGCLIIAVYLKTGLTFLHEFLRKICLKMRHAFLKVVFVKIVAIVVKFLEIIGKKTNVRGDNIRIESQVEDWFFVPLKYFFTVEELIAIFNKSSLTFEILCRQTGRLKSSSNIIVRGIKC